MVILVYKVDRKKVGEVIMKGLKYIRQAFGMTMKDLGEELKVSSNTINLLEKGSMKPTEERLDQLEEFFMIDRNLFFKDQYTEDEVLLIETRRFEKIVGNRNRKNMMSKYSFSKLIENNDKKEDFEAFVEALNKAYEKLHFGNFIDLMDCLYDIVECANSDTNSITPLQYVNEISIEVINKIVDKRPKYEMESFDRIDITKEVVEEYLSKNLEDYIDIIYHYNDYLKKINDK
jgi:transcriptional regulator with XRE-family HTH domain